MDKVGGIRGISTTCALVVGTVIGAGACGDRTGLSLDDIGDFTGGGGGVSSQTVGSTGGSVVIAPTQGGGGSVVTTKPVATGGIATSSDTTGGFTGTLPGSGGIRASSGGFASGGRSFVSPVDASTIVVDAATDAATGPAVIGPTEGGTCTMPLELPSTDDVWWEAGWTRNAPPLPSSQCGLVAGKQPAAPAVVARWVAPREGAYSVYAWSRDFDAVVSLSATCGDRSGGCAELEPTNLPAVPVPTTFGSSGWGNVPFKAGDVLFIWFQNDHESDAAAPNRGVGIAHIKRSD